LNIDVQGACESSGWDAERYRFVYWSGFFVSIESSQRETLLHIDGHEAARLDESVTMPHFFRWSEITSIARYFEAHQDSPTEPSVATLLLAPFLAITDVERTAVRAEFGRALDSLDLLEPVEISDILDRRCISETEWVATPDVGWSLFWDRDRTATASRSSPVYSERVSGAPFGPRLLKLLRVASGSDGRDSLS
jgi:hypothetical protein